MDRSHRQRTGRGTITRRRSRPIGATEAAGVDARTVKLMICALLFALALLTKFAFPGVFVVVSEQMTASVDYETAFKVLGEGLSGERKFTAAVGEAITYAFKGVSVTEQAVGEAESADGATTQTFGEVENEGAVEGRTDVLDTPEAEIKDAIISAFLETQEVYSDYNLPAGTTYEMPILGISYAAPVMGELTSGYGFREHPADRTVKFHYGVDYAVEEGTSVKAFADGEVTAVGESAVMGKYVLMSHEGAETKYAHCSEVLVTTGQAVVLGEEIAKSGATGNATSPCLHFELLIEGIWVNPSYYLERL